MNPTTEPYSGPITTDKSAKEGRLVVDAGLKAKRKKSLQERVRKESTSPKN